MAAIMQPQTPNRYTYKPKRVVDLSKECTPTTINELSTLLIDCEVIGIVVKVNPKKEYKKSGHKATKSSIIIADACDTCTLTCWNQATEMLDSIALGDIIKITRPLVREKSAWSLITTSAYELVIEATGVGASVTKLQGAELVAFSARFSLPPSRIKIKTWDELVALHDASIVNSRIGNTGVVALAVKIMEPSTVETKNGSMEKHSLYCIDWKNRVMLVDFWGDDANILKNGTVVEGKTVLLLANLRMNIFKNRKTFTVGSSTIIMVSIHGPDARRVLSDAGRYNLGIKLVQSEIEKEEASKQPPQLDLAIYKTIYDLRNALQYADPNADNSTVYCTIASVQLIDSTTALYPACSGCNRKLESITSRCVLPQCVDRGTQWKYALRCRLVDFSGSLRTVLFGRAANSLMEVEPEEFAKFTEERQRLLLNSKVWKRYKVYSQLKLRPDGVLGLEVVDVAPVEYPLTLST